MSALPARFVMPCMFDGNFFCAPEFCFELDVRFRNALNDEFAFGFEFKQFFAQIVSDRRVGTARKNLRLAYLNLVEVNRCCFHFRKERLETRGWKLNLASLGARL